MINPVRANVYPAKRKILSKQNDKKLVPRGGALHLPASHLPRVCPAIRGAMLNTVAMYTCFGHTSRGHTQRSPRVVTD
jgi:hypothetical protein